jgi:hypothetical protein
MDRISSALNPAKLENFAFAVFLLPYERGGGLDQFAAALTNSG